MPIPYTTSPDEHFKLTAETLPAMVWTTGTNSEKIYFNNAWVKYTGRQIEQLQQNGWTESIHAHDKQRVLNHFKNAFNRQEDFKTQYRLLRHDGVYCWIVSSAMPCFAADNGFTGYTGTCIDIDEFTVEKLNSEYAQIETPQKGPAMLAAIIESSEDAIISKTLEGIITSWNRGAERVFGYQENETIGKHISLIIPKERLDEETLIIQKISNNESIEHFETVRITKHGKRIPLSLTVSPIRNKFGRVIGASKIARDISKTKEAEERLQSYAETMEILNTVGQVISADLDVQSILQKVTDATTQLTDASFGAFFHNATNENGESYLLYTLSGAPREAFEKFGAPRITKIFDPTFGGKETVRVDDVTKDPRYGQNAPHNGMPEGHLPVVSYLAVPVISKSGYVFGRLFFGHVEAGKFTKEHENLVAGVASQAAAALDNAKLYEEIKELNARKDEFIGMASHELKTPVTSVKGYLQIIERDQQMNDRTKQFVNKALQQVNKLSTLISDLLDVSKIQSGKMPFSISTFDVNSLLKDVGEMMEQSNPSHHIEYELAAVPLTVNADQQRIEQVIINLISNAVKYSPKADRIIVKSYNEGDHVKVAVQDFGIGIEQAHLDSIFSRFYRVDNLAAHISGLGIGLYITHEIIRRHDGKLQVESTPGVGSTFYFELPITKKTQE